MKEKEKETAMSAAMKRAGLNVVTSALYVAAVEALRERSLPEALRIFTKQLLAKRQLLDALALPYLQDVASDMKKPGHSSNDETTTPAPGLSGGPLADEAPKHAAAKDDRQPPAATQWTTAVVPPISSKRRDAAKRAARAEIDALDPIFKIRRISGTYIGNLRWRELQEIARRNSWTAAKALERGTIATENVFLCMKILNYAKPVDPDARVHNIVPPAKLVSFMNEIRIEVPQFIAKAEEEHARRTLNHREIQHAS
jgi:hypothetical protein